MLQQSLLQAAQNDPQARRAKNRRAQAYIGSTLMRGDYAQRSTWVFFSSLLELNADRALTVQRSSKYFALKDALR